MSHFPPIKSAHVVLVLERRAAGLREEEGEAGALVELKHAAALLVEPAGDDQRWKCT